MGMKSSGGGGEIVQVQGGHIVRSTGRKDRHSKVYTSKGPRDRRVRLSAYTAIQFYDVQDRLGYDRPSKAVDWLITKAQSAIDKLAALPPWHPPTPADHPPQPAAAGVPYNFNFNGPNENEPSSTPIHFQGFSEMASQDHDLCLSLHSFHHAPSTDQMGLFGDPAGGFMFSGGSPAPASSGTMMFREPLQSSFDPPQAVRAWDDVPVSDRRFGLPEFCLPPEIGDAGASRR